LPPTDTSTWSSFYVFDLRNGQLSPIYIAPSAVNGEPEIVTAELDIARTRLQKAHSFCLIRKTIFDPEHPAPRPTIAWSRGVLVRISQSRRAGKSPSPKLPGV
jgi:hypothetical protein